MSHARQQIREAVATAVTGLTTTGSAVYETRVYAFDVVPCLAVYTPSEEVWETDQAMGSDSNKQTRALSVVVEARTKKATLFDDQLDTICAEVEAAVMGDGSLAALVKAVDYVGVDIEYDSESEQPTAAAAIRWRVLYRVNITDLHNFIET